MNYFEGIESYLNDELNGSEHQLFETELAKNADLQRAVAEYRIIFGLLKSRKQPPMSAEDVAETARLRKVVAAAFDDDEAIVTSPPKEDNTEIYPPLVGVKKTNILWRAAAAKTNTWWRAAAAIAVVAAASIWFYQRSNTSQPIIAETPNATAHIDTVKKVEDIKPEEERIAIQPKVPQYQTPIKPPPDVSEIENMPIVPPGIVEKTEPPVSDAAFFAEVKTVLEREKTELSSRGDNDIESEFKAVINLLLLKKSEEALVKLTNLKGDKAQFYRAMAYSITDRNQAKLELESLLKKTQYSDKQLNEKVKRLLDKLK